MPRATVYQILSESEEEKPIGTLSYRNDWTFTEARVQLEKLGLVDYEFQFKDLDLDSPMQIKWENANFLEDCNSKIIILPKSPNPVCRTSADDQAHVSFDLMIDIRSSDTSNLPSTSRSQAWDTGWDTLLSPRREDEWPDEWSSDPTESVEPSELVPLLDPHITFESTIMTNELKKQWSTCVDRLKDHMIASKIEHHKWKALTYDEDGVAIGKIECLECDSRFDGASRGTMTNASIRNCFTNFREKHIVTSKHIGKVAEKRGEKLDGAELSRRVADRTLDDKTVFEQHLKIVERVNQSQSGSQLTFAIVGDMEKEPLQLQKFKLQCTYCFVELVMIPRQRNLETNLVAHCTSLSHVHCVNSSQLPSSGQPVRSGKPGRPRQADKRDVRQKLIGGFFSPCSSEAGSSEQSIGASIENPRGSDACEQFFSKVGGMKGHERSYDLSELVDCATSLNCLVALDLVEGMRGVGKSHKKHSNIWMKLHPVENETIVDQTDYTGIENNVEVVAALQEGFAQAQSAATKLQMNPSASFKNKLWWSRPWEVEAKGVKFGGWCDIDVSRLGDTDIDALLAAPDVVPDEVSDEVVASNVPCDVQTDGVSDEVVASAGCQEVMSEIFSVMNSEELIYGNNILPTISGIVSYQGRQMYKSTLVSQLTSNPFQSKDRLTRVKQSLYFNSLVDKPVVREGVHCMWMSVGSDCGVYFLEESQMKTRENRSAKAIAKSFKGKGRTTGRKNPKRPRGEAIDVETLPEGTKTRVSIGRVQSIWRTYGGSVGRSKQPVDLLDRPPADAQYRVVFNWFRPLGSGRDKFAYDICDLQEIDLECVISTVTFSISPSNKKVFLLDANDINALDDFVKGKGG